MSELRDLTKLVVLVTLIGVSGLIIFQYAKSSQYHGDLTVSYTANITISKFCSFMNPTHITFMPAGTECFTGTGWHL